LEAFSVIAAAKQMVPPSTAAGIEADMRRGTFREIDGLGVRRDQANASVHKATIPMEAVCQDGRGLNGEGNRREVRLFQPPEKRPRTMDDDEKDWEMTLNRYCFLEFWSPLGARGKHSHENG
jgi:hypothetical protein